MHTNPCAQQRFASWRPVGLDRCWPWQKPLRHWVFRYQTAARPGCRQRGELAAVMGRVGAWALRVRVVAAQAYQAESPLHHLHLLMVHLHLLLVLLHLLHLLLVHLRALLRPEAPDRKVLARPANCRPWGQEPLLARARLGDRVGLPTRASQSAPAIARPVCCRPWGQQPLLARARLGHRVGLPTRACQSAPAAAGLASCPSWEQNFLQVRAGARVRACSGLATRAYPSAPAAAALASRPSWEQNFLQVRAGAQGRAFSGLATRANYPGQVVVCAAPRRYPAAWSCEDRGSRLGGCA